MTISIKKIIDQINYCLASNITTSNINKLQLASNLINDSRVVSVSCLQLLPPASENKGRLFFVSDIGAYRFSDGTNWSNDHDTSYSLISKDIYTWGRNNYGQLGNGTISCSSSPSTIATNSTCWSSVSSASHNIAIKADGTLWTWGIGFYGRLGTNDTSNRSSPVTTIAGGNDWCLASAGRHSSAAIKNDSSLWVWGSNYLSTLGDGTSTYRSSPVQIAYGGTWAKVSVGNNFGVGLKTDGALCTWGFNNHGQLGDGTTTRTCSPVAIAGGGTNWCQVTASFCSSAAAIKTDGTLWTWGYNAWGILGDGTPHRKSSPVTTAGGGTNWCHVSFGLYSASAIKMDGTLWTWGSGMLGVLGDSNSSPRSSPGTTVGGGTNWRFTATGAYTTAAIKTDGTLWTWGRNSHGQLGDGTTSHRSSPGTTAGGGTNWSSVSVGVSHIASIKTEASGFNAI